MKHRASARPWVGICKISSGYFTVAKRVAKNIQQTCRFQSAQPPGRSGARPGRFAALFRAKVDKKKPYPSTWLEKGAKKLIVSLMEWIFLILGLLFIVLSLIVLQVGMGVFYTHNNHESWDSSFFSNYKSCCLLIDLRTRAPFAILGVAFLRLTIWKLRKTK